MQNKEIEKILDANVDIITYKADKDFRGLTSTEKTLLENNERIKQYINQLEIKVKELEKKNKIIDLMALDIYGMQIECNRCFKDIEEVKQYFEKKVEDKQ